MAWSLLHAKVHQTLRSRQLLARNQRLLVAVSGGQDSLCLLQIIQDLQPRWQWQIGVIHCDHQWRSDSAANAQFVKAWVEAQHIPFYLCQFNANQPQNDRSFQSEAQSEATARQWRYQQFLQIAFDYDYPCVLTGHTASDRAETLLYNLMRGSGSDGLGALQWKRSFEESFTSNLDLSLTHSPITIVRPLLNLKRQETAQFCQAFKLPIWEDSTNHDRHYQRNRIRLELLPYLQEHFNPQVSLQLAQTAELIQTDVQYLEQEATAQRSQLQVNGKLHRPGLKKLHLALQRRVIRQFLRDYLPQPPSYDHIEKTVALIHAPQRSQTDPFPGGTIARVAGEWIELSGLP